MIVATAAKVLTMVGPAAWRSLLSVAPRCLLTSVRAGAVCDRIDSAAVGTSQLSGDMATRVEPRAVAMSMVVLGFIKGFLMVINRLLEVAIGMLNRLAKVIGDEEDNGSEPSATGNGSHGH